MRRLFLFKAPQVPYASSRVASSFFAGGNGGGSRRQSRDRTRDNNTSNFGADNRTAKEGVPRAPSSSGVRETASRGVKKTELLFPDAQAHELDDMDVDGHDRVMIEEQSLAQEEGDVHAPPNLKRRYDSYFRPKREAVVLTSSFADRVSAEVNNEEHEDDVTKIYTRDEVVTELNEINNKDNARGVRREVMSFAKSSRTNVELNNRDEEDWEDDVTKVRTRANILRDAHEIGEPRNARSIERSACDAPEMEEAPSGTKAHGNHDDALEGEGEAEDGYGDEDVVDKAVSKREEQTNEFENVKKHPFFEDLLSRMERNAVRQRQQIKSTGRYNLEAVNLCLRPLLQLTDYPFTIRQLSQMAPFLYPALLRRSLPDIKACRRLHIYRSADTDVVLDWSVEDFLRRRYESIHLSWEPVKIVMLRFAWNDEVMSDRDCLLYFSKFQDYIELAELELSAGDEKPRAIPIGDVVRAAEQRPIPVSKLLIRRKPAEETEPSVTEAIRLMGTPALLKPARSKKTHTSEKDSVEGTFERIQREAAGVDGNEAARLRHAIDMVPSLRQASSPSGRSIKDFSLGKQQNAVISEGVPRHSAKVESHPFDEGRLTYTPALYDALANAYHKKKVEASQLRRRLLNTDSIDQATELQEKLALTQKELPRLREKLEKIRQLRRMEKEGSPTKSHSFLSKAVEESNEKEKPTATVENMASLLRESAAGTLKGQSASTVSPIVRDEFVEHHPLEKNRKAAEDTSRENELTKAAEKSETESYHAHHYNVPPSEEIKSLSSAALMLRQEIETLQEKRRHEEKALLTKMEEALGTLLKIEATMRSVSQREAKEAEAHRLAAQRQKEEAERQARREQAEARARALEEELLRRHEERVKVLNRQREEARQAQREAEVALERQRQAEQAALEAEAELERRLEEAKSKIWNEEVKEVLMPVSPALETSTATPAANNTKPSAKREMSCTPSSSVANTNDTTAEPSCTPEQYDGLCLGAERLRKEIMELERQMENEGDEDDMTLMAVLATSRSDLEELEDFIRVVRQREPWAAERDRARHEEAERLVKERGERPNDVQEKISAIRFQIDLMEKRLQHATERNVISKLEQRIINARREISRLRIEQDRLRRSGLHADAGGIYVPPSISIAETLAGAEDKTTEAISGVAIETECTGEMEEVVNAQGAVKVQARGEEMEDNGTKQRETPRDVEGSVTHHANCHGESEAADDAEYTLAGTVQHDEEELKQLTNRMESMLGDIRHLEEKIALKGSGCSAETTAASLAELQTKLQQLLEVRDAIKRRTGQVALDERPPKHAPAAERTARAKGPAEGGRRPAVLAPPSGRPVSGHATRAGAEVLHFEHRPSRAAQHTAPQRSATAGRKTRKTAKPKKTSR